jgi:hypothetical protein
MCVIEGRSQRFEEARDLVGRDSLVSLVQAAQVVCERWALQVFHYNIRVAVYRVEVKYLYDIRMP